MSSRSMCVVAWIRRSCIFMVELYSTVWTSPSCLSIPPWWTLGCLHFLATESKVAGRVESAFSVLVCINLGEEFLGHMVILVPSSGSSQHVLSRECSDFHCLSSCCMDFGISLYSHVCCALWLRGKCFSHSLETIYILECCLFPGLPGLFLWNVN